MFDIIDFFLSRCFGPLLGYMLHVLTLDTYIGITILASVLNNPGIFAEIILHSIQSCHTFCSCKFPPRFLLFHSIAHRHYIWVSIFVSIYFYISWYIRLLIDQHMTVRCAARRRPSAAAVGVLVTARRHHRNMAHGPEPPPGRGYRLYRLLLCGLLFAAAFNWKLSVPGACTRRLFVCFLFLFFNLGPFGP